MIPSYRALVDSGCEVFVAGRSPSEPLAKICPRYLEVDYSDVDKVEALISAYSIDCLVPGCTDLSYQVCSQIGMGRFSGIDTPEVTKCIHNKESFREMALNLGLSVPKLLEKSEINEDTKVIVKPVDGFSGHGISIVNSSDSSSLASACAHAESVSGSKRCMIEEYIQGQLFSHSAFLRGGEIVADFIVREDSVIDAFAVDTSCLEYNFDPQIRDHLRADVLKLHEHLQLVDGLVHTQFILNNSGYWIIEVTRRCPGDLYSMLIEVSTGYAYGASYIDPFIGGHANRPVSGEHERRIIRHTVSSREPQTYLGLRFLRPLLIEHFAPIVSVGEFIGSGVEGRVGILFINADTADSFEEIYASLLNSNLYHIS